MSFETGSWSTPSQAKKSEGSFDFGDDPWGSIGAEAGYRSAADSGFGPETGSGTSTGFGEVLSAAEPTSYEGFDFGPDTGFGTSGFDTAPTQGFEVNSKVETQKTRFKDTIRDFAHHAVETVVAFKPESKFAAIAQAVPDNFSIGGAGDTVRGVMDNVREDAQATWNNRGDVLKAGGNYVANAGVEVGKQGLSAALEVIKKDTGVGFEKDENGVNKLKIRKVKLAKFAVKAVFTGGGSILKTGRKAGVAGVGSLREGAVSQVQTARSQAVQSAKSYAASQFST